MTISPKRGGGSANPKNPYQKKLRWSKKGEGGGSLSFLTKSKKKQFFLRLPLPTLILGESTMEMLSHLKISVSKSAKVRKELNVVPLLFPIASYSTSEESQFHEIFAVKASQRRTKSKGIKHLNVTNAHNVLR